MTHLHKYKEYFTIHPVQHLTINGYITGLCQLPNVNDRKSDYKLDILSKRISSSSTIALYITKLAEVCSGNMWQVGWNYLLVSAASPCFNPCSLSPFLHSSLHPNLFLCLVPRVKTWSRGPDGCMVEWDQHSCLQPRFNNSYIWFILSHPPPHYTVQPFSTHVWVRRGYVTAFSRTHNFSQSRWLVPKLSDHL